MEESIETMQESTIAISDRERKLDDMDDVEMGIGDEPERKKQKPDEGEPVISSYYNQSDSDITLVSSDQVHFKVHACLSRRVSLMFRESLPSSAPQGGYDLITLSDPDIESSAVLEKFLDLIYPVPQHDLSQALVYQKVIQLARKWECLHALEILYNAVLLSITNAQKVARISGLTNRRNNPPDYLFIIAAGLEDMELLRTVVAQCSSLTRKYDWMDRNYVCEGEPAGAPRSGWPDAVAYPRAFDFGAWSLDHYNALQPEIIWCMIYSRKFKGKPDWEVISTQFIDLLKKRYDRPVIGVGPSTLSELAAVRLRYKAHPRADLSFPFANTWRRVSVAEDDHAISPEGSQEQTPEANTTNPVPHEKYDDEDADMFMISSDNVSFRVHSVIMRKASPVFSSLLSLAPASTPIDPLIFTDPDLEDSTMIEAMLDAIYHSKVLPFEDDCTFLIPTLVELGDKWEVEPVHRVVRSALMAAVFIEEAKEPEYFALAMQLKAFDIIRGMIALGHSHPVIRILVGLDHDYPVDDYGKMIELFYAFNQIPSEMAWALQRAGLMWDHGYERDSGIKRSPAQEARRWRVVANQFHQIMDTSYWGCHGPTPFGSRGSWNIDYFDDTDEEE